MDKAVDAYAVVRTRRTSSSGNVKSSSLPCCKCKRASTELMGESESDE